jgi:hypothetical protein
MSEAAFRKLRFEESTVSIRNARLPTPHFMVEPVAGQGPATHIPQTGNMMITCCSNVVPICFLVSASRPKQAQTARGCGSTSLLLSQMGSKNREPAQLSLVQNDWSFKMRLQ